MTLIFGVMIFIFGAAIAWVFPVGPMYWALGWTPLLLVAALVALIFVGFSSSSRMTIKRLRPSPRDDGTMIVESQALYGRAINTGILAFLWFLTGFILLSLVFGLA